MTYDEANERIAEIARAHALRRSTLEEAAAEEIAKQKRQINARLEQDLITLREKSKSESAAVWDEYRGGPKSSSPIEAAERQAQYYAALREKTNPIREANRIATRARAIARQHRFDDYSVDGVVAALRCKGDEMFGMFRDMLAANPSEAAAMMPTINRVRSQIAELGADPKDMPDTDTLSSLYTKRQSGEALTFIERGDRTAEAVERKADVPFDLNAICEANPIILTEDPFRSEH